MIVGVEIIPRLVQTFEPPAIKLPREGFVLTLHKVFGHDVLNEELFVVNLPCPTVRLQGDEYGTIRVQRKRREG